MFTFITNNHNACEPDILTINQHKPLLIVSLEGQWLARYNPPSSGWTQQTLQLLSHSFPEQWAFCGAEALLGEHPVGVIE